MFEHAIDNSRGLLVENEPFTKMEVQISNIQANIFGSGVEKIDMWFKDTSVITDLANNTFAPEKIRGNLKHHEYIPSGETIQRRLADC